MSGDGAPGGFQPFYRRWNITNAVVLTVGSAAIAAGGVIVAPIVAVWSLASMATLFLVAKRRLSGGTGHPLPNTLTGTRALAAVALLAALPAVSSAPQWLMMITLGLALVETTDFFDGRLARRLGPSEFGASWDMESDALFTLSLSLLLRVAYGVPPFVVAIGLMRYLYVILWRYVRDPVAVPRGYKLFARITAATIVVTMIVVVAPVIPSWLRLTALLVVLIMQIVSFGWDLLLQRRG